METISKREQQLAVLKVLEEMQAIENKLLEWNTYWKETCFIVHCKDLIGQDISDIKKLEKRYSKCYNLFNLYHGKEKILKKGELLRKATLIDESGKEYECEFDEVEWNISHGAHRIFSFENNGDIYFSKDIWGKVSRIPMISANYNVLSNNFTFNIIVKECEETNYITVSLKDNNLIVKYNNIKITEDLNTGVKIIQLTYLIKIYGDIILNPDNSISEANLRINSNVNSNKNGKLYGHYEFNISQNNGISCSFYSLAGRKCDLNNNPLVLENLKKLLSELFSVQYKDDRIIYKLIHDVMYAIVQNSTNDYIDSNSVAIDMKIINEIFDYINEILNNIKGEIPLPGLVSRIDNFLSKNNSSRLEERGHSKKIKKKNR